MRDLYFFLIVKVGGFLLSLVRRLSGSYVFQVVECLIQRWTTPGMHDHLDIAGM
jgi:hypothetical protein